MLSNGPHTTGFEVALPSVHGVSPKQQLSPYFAPIAVTLRALRDRLGSTEVVRITTAPTSTSYLPLLGDFGVLDVRQVQAAPQLYTVFSHLLTDCSTNVYSSAHLSLALIPSADGCAKLNEGLTGNISRSGTSFALQVLNDLAIAIVSFEIPLAYKIGEGVVAPSSAWADVVSCGVATTCNSALKLLDISRLREQILSTSPPELRLMSYEERAAERQQRITLWVKEYEQELMLPSKKKPQSP